MITSAAKRVKAIPRITNMNSQQLLKSNSFSSMSRLPRGFKVMNIGQTPSSQSFFTTSPSNSGQQNDLDMSFTSMPQLPEGFKVINVGQTPSLPIRTENILTRETQNDYMALSASTSDQQNNLEKTIDINEMQIAYQDDDGNIQIHADNRIFCNEAVSSASQQIYNDGNGMDESVASATEETANDFLENENDQHRRKNHIDRLLQVEAMQHKLEQCCSPCRNILLLILDAVQDIKSEIKNNKCTGSNHHNNVNHQLESNYDKLGMLPNNDRNALLEFDCQLIDPAHHEMKKQFLQKMESLAGQDYKKVIATILSEILTDDLAENCTWLIKKPHKSTISHYNFPKVIINFIQKKYNVSEDVIQKRMQLWLQKTGDRKRIKNEKAKKEAEILEKELLLNQ